MRRTVPGSVVVAVMALHTVAWLAFDVVDPIAVANAVPATQAGTAATAAVLGARAIAVGTLLLVGVVCYRVGSQTDLGSSYREFLRRLGSAGAIGGVVGVTLLGVVAATGVLPTDLSLTVGTTAAFGTTAAVKGAVAAGVVGFAAAALGTFRSEATGETDRSAPVADD